MKGSELCTIPSLTLLAYKILFVEYDHATPTLLSHKRCGTQGVSRLCVDLLCNMANHHLKASCVGLSKS